MQLTKWTEELHAEINKHAEHEIVTEPAANGHAQTRCVNCNEVLLDASEYVGVDGETSPREVSVDWWVAMTARVDLDTGEVKHVVVCAEEGTSVLPDQGCVHFTDDAESQRLIAIAANVFYREREAGRLPRLTLEGSSDTI